MPKPRKDLLEKYWNLLEKLGWEHELGDFTTDETLKTALDTMEEEVKRLKDAEGDLSEETEGEK